MTNKKEPWPTGPLGVYALVTPCVEESETKNVSDLMLSSLDDCLGVMKGNCCEMRTGNMREPHAILC